MKLTIKIKYSSMLLLVLTLLLTTSTSQATDSSTAGQFINRLNLLLEKPIPELSQVIPHYTRPKSENKSLIVGVFSNESDDALNWGLLLSEMIRINLSSLPEKPVDIGNHQLSHLKYDARSIYYTSDKTIDLTDYENLLTLGQRYGINKILSGSVKKVDQLFSINFEISDSKTKEVNREAFSFEKRNLKSQLRLMLKWVYLQLGSNNEKDLNRIKKFGPDSIELLSDFAPILDNLYLDKRTKFSEKFISKLTSETNFPTAQYHQIINQSAGKSVLEHNNKISNIANKYPNSQAIQSIAAKSFWHLNQPGLLQTNIIDLQETIAASPVEYSNILWLTGVLVKYGKALDAIAVAKEEIIRWPHRHRSWWQLSFAVEKLAWQYRGNDYWRDTPEKGKEYFEKLIDFSKDAIDIEIKLHPSSGGGYGNRISLHGSYSGEMYQDFLKAIRYDPKKKHIYNSALNYSSPKWGGSVTIQKKIYQLAQEHGLPKTDLEELWYEYIEPNQNKSTNLLQKIATKLGISKVFSQHGFLSTQLVNNKDIIFWCGTIVIFLLFLFFTRQSKIRKQHQELVTIKYNELLFKIYRLQEKLKLQQINLIIEPEEFGFYLPQIEHYYHVVYESNSVKVDSHLGIINDGIEDASTTMIKMIESGMK